MTELRFPDGFLWGTATAGHQVEGDNRNSDWWAWEHDPASPFPIAEPSGDAVDHYRRFAEDIGTLADLGLHAYRFSVEWARVEPAQGRFDEDVLNHYSQVVDACTSRGVTPIVTLQHFTLPKWFADGGGWLHPAAVSRFVTYTRAVMERIGGRVPYVCTINEPGQMLTRSYLGTFPTPPFERDLGRFDAATEAVNSSHRAARDEIRRAFPGTKVGMAHSLQHWNPGSGAEPLLGWVRELYEDRFLTETVFDDFIGVQTYTRIDVDAPPIARPFLGALVRSRFLQERVLLPLLRSSAKEFEHTDGPSEERLTEMGYPWAPDAVVHSLRRMADLFPGKELLITEHGIATDRDEERIEYVEAALRAIHGLIADGLPISGYLHWSLLDNFEWWDGYRPKFGLISVDRTTQERTVKPSGRWLGGVAERSAL